LYNDFIMHQQASKTLSAAKATVHAPKCHKYITSDIRAWWDSRLARFPKITSPITLSSPNVYQYFRKPYVIGLLTVFAQRS
jgi:hypothetical protein